MSSEIELLEHSFRIALDDDPTMSRLEFLAELIFDFTTYDLDAAELFASKALEVCSALSERKTFEYIEEPENYRWFLIMVNMPFFAGRLNWGTSIRGAWWDHDSQVLENSGLWEGDKQVLSMRFTPDEWLRFVAAMIEFAKG